MKTWLVGWALTGCAVVAVAASDELVTGSDLEIGSFQVGSSVETATTLVLDLEVRNQGDVTWSADDGFALAYHWFDQNGDAVVWDGLRSPLVDQLEPGAARIFEVVLRTPDRAGEYLLQWDVVQEGMLWVSEVDPTPVVPHAVRVTATHAFSLLRVSTPKVLWTGGDRVASVVVRNDGTRTWPGDGSVSLSYHWLAANGEVKVWEGRRTAVTRPVEPGESIELDAVVTAPGSARRYRLLWDMVDDGVCWFSERDASPEPSVAVLVFPVTTVYPFLWSVLVVVVAVIAVRRARSGRLTGVWAVADVVWCAAALVIKQVWVLGGAGLGFSAAGWWLSCAAAALIGLVLLVLPVRFRPWASWVTAVLVTMVLFADLIHVRFFGDLMSVAALHSANQIGQVEASVRSLLVPGDLWFWADLPAALVLMLAVSRIQGGSVPRRRLAAVLGLTIVGFSLLGAIALRGAPASLRQVFHTTHLARQVGVLNIHAMDSGRAVMRGVFRPELDSEDYLAVMKFFDDRRQLRAGSGPFFAVAQRRNLVMIQVESLQAFVVGFRVGGREVTPFLNSLAAENIFFANVTDQTEEGRSSDSELATQVSLLPPDRGAAAFLYAENTYTGLASILAEHGYVTMSAVPFNGSFWNRRVTHQAYGFARSLFVGDFDPGEEIGWGLNDRDFLSQAAEHLTELSEPWCAYLLTLSLHHPFEGFPEHLEVLDVGDWEGSPFGNYLHTMHHFDRALADFMAALDDAGMIDNTVIALWGDHDAGFEWRSEIAAAIGVVHDATGWYLSQQVPLVIRLPGADTPTDARARTSHPLSAATGDAENLTRLTTQAGEIRGLTLPAGHADVAPTLLALLGVDPAPYAFTGRNLLGSPGSGPVVGEYRCWRDATHLYLRRGPLLTDGECVELESMRKVDSAACSASFEKARREVEISRLVLEHDLQLRLHQP